MIMPWEQNKNSEVNFLMLSPISKHMRVAWYTHMFQILHILLEWLEHQFSDSWANTAWLIRMQFKSCSIQHHHTETLSWISWKDIMKILNWSSWPTINLSQSSVFFIYQGNRNKIYHSSSLYIVAFEIGMSVKALCYCNFPLPRLSYNKIFAVYKTPKAYLALVQNAYEHHLAKLLLASNFENFTEFFMHMI